MSTNQEVAIDLVADLRRLLERSAPSDRRLRVGADVVSINEFAKLLATRSGQAFLNSRFTQDERAYAAGRCERLAVRWAAKEAVAKAVGTGFRGLKPSQIEIIHADTGEALIRPVGSEAWPYDAHVWDWALTLSHEGDAALAIAVAVVPYTTISNPSHGTHLSSKPQRAGNADMTGASP